MSKFSECELRHLEETNIWVSLFYSIEYFTEEVAKKPHNSGIGHFINKFFLTQNWPFKCKSTQPH